MTQQTSQHIVSLDTHLSTLSAQVGGLRDSINRTLDEGASNRVEQCKTLVADLRQTLHRIVQEHDGLVRALNTE
jgi:ABC-type transporter Mla subunit MlaD